MFPANMYLVIFIRIFQFPSNLANIIVPVVPRYNGRNFNWTNEIFDTIQCGLFCIKRANTP